MEREYELKLTDGRRAMWNGTSPEDAARRYVDCHRTAVVVAWRRPTGYGMLSTLSRGARFLEPGDPGYTR